MKKGISKRTLTIIIILLVLLGIYFYVRKSRGNRPLPVPDDRTEPDDNSDDESGGNGKYTDDSFPLSKDSGGENVRTLQKMLVELGGDDTLPQYGVDGKFGDETANALSELGYSEIVTEEVMDDIIADVQESSNNDGNFWSNLF